MTLVVFVLGLLIGVAFEANRLDKINEYYAQSEISLMDLFVLNNLVNQDADCSVLIDSHIVFADRIYEEASLMEKYQQAGRLSSNIKLAHQRYDLIRTFLWINIEKTMERCSEEGEFNSVVYLYEYEPKDLAQKATQGVWSKVLFDLKQAEGGNILLIPIAVNTGVASTEAMASRFKIVNYPVVVVNSKHVLSDLVSAEDISKLL